MFIKNFIRFLSSIADTPKNTAEEKRQHRFLIYMGLLMSSGGICWGSITLFSGLPYQSMVPFGYGILTIMNLTYLYFSKNFHVSQAIQIFMSLLLPFLFQLSLGGYVSSGAQVFWSILAILGAFTFKQNRSIISWFILYLGLLVLSGLVDEEVRSLGLVEVSANTSVLFFTISIFTLSIIIFSLFYYFVGSERKYRASLEENIITLKNTQKQLIEAEKMSALGGLVAGVAHEVNTPLGISITAASIFKNKIENLKKAIEQNSLSKTDLNEFIADLSEADSILIKNLDRAAVLIKNFKKVSVDQSSEDRREFELNAYIHEITSTFVSELRKNKTVLNFQLSAEPIYMNSYPGAIFQIIINLLQNSILHAFEETQDKQILIKTETEGEYTIITCSDNGKGIQNDLSSKVFEPFVTTKRNNGGTGLGLNITYNLVTQYLNGTIQVDTESEQGASFIIKIPRNVEKEA